MIAVRTAPEASTPGTKWIKKVHLLTEFFCFADKYELVTSLFQEDENWQVRSRQFGMRATHLSRQGLICETCAPAPSLS
jgi:hypothetical protein